MSLLCDFCILGTTHSSLHEHTGGGQRDDHVRCVLDRVLVTSDLETRFYRDVPLQLSSREEERRLARRFFIEKQWLIQAVFVDRVIDVWNQAKARPRTAGAFV